MGLDYSRMFSPKEKQISVFKEQLQIACDLHMPIYLHCRNDEKYGSDDAHRDFLALLKEWKASHPSLQGIVHCFTSTREEMKTYLDLGFYIGVTGWICDERRNSALKDALAILPPDRIVLETDSPFLIIHGNGTQEETNLIHFGK